MLTTMQTDSLDSATLDLQISPGGRTDSLLAKDETFPELRYFKLYLLTLLHIILLFKKFKKTFQIFN